MKKSPVSDRMAKVEARLGKTTGASKGSKPAPPAKVTVRPTGGLKPSGVKAKWEKKF
jgi:hypothetical protein